MNKYQYTMLLSPVNESELLTFMEGTNAKLIMKLSIIVQSDLSEEDKVKDLENKIGTNTPDGEYEFVGYEDLVKLITN